MEGHLPAISAPFYDDDVWTAGLWTRCIGMWTRTPSVPRKSQEMDALVLTVWSFALHTAALGQLLIAVCYELSIRIDHGSVVNLITQPVGSVCSKLDADRNKLSINMFTSVLTPFSVLYRPSFVATPRIEHVCSAASSALSFSTCPPDMLVGSAAQLACWPGWGFRQAFSSDAEGCGCKDLLTSSILRLFSVQPHGSGASISAPNLSSRSLCVSSSFSQPKNRNPFRSCAIVLVLSAHGVDDIFRSHVVSFCNLLHVTFLEAVI